MIFSNMAYPGKDYRVLVYDSWLGEDFHSLDNPQDGDKIVYREIGEDGQPIVTKTEVYSNGEWAEEGSGGDGGDGGGDGGGGDYTVASVHLVAYNGVNPVGIYINQDDNSNLPGIFDNGVGFNSSLQTDGGEGAPTELTADLLMYGDSVGCSIYGNFISATGGASYSDDDYTLTITGDCTVTLEFND